MAVFDRYMLKNLAIATVFVAITLSVVIILTQSLRFLELVIESGASSSLFWILTLLALPRFFEIILPLSLMVGVIFIYSRMISDSEMVVMRSSGVSPLTLARPAIILGLLVSLFLMGMTLWAAPKSLRMMKEMRQEIKAQFSTALFREGVFNQAGAGLTVYIREKIEGGELRGILIHDSRVETEKPATVIAKRGVLLSNDDGFEVVVYDGSRQEFDAEKRVLSRLNFDRYTIDLPDSGQVRQRWKEADERTIFELLQPDMDNPRDAENLRQFYLEIHKRVISPLLALVFTLISCSALLLGPFDRRGQGVRIIFAVIGTVLMQGLYIAVSNIAQQSDYGHVMLYTIIIVPSVFCLFMLSSVSEGVRRQFLYRPKAKEQA